MVRRRLLPSLAALLLPLLFGQAAGTQAPFFNVYQQCTAPDGVVGECRSEPQLGVVASVNATVTTYPIDMSLPCANGRKCSENVDAALAPLQPPAGPGVRSCSVVLMPWSPFPCAFNEDAYEGKSDQNATNLCYGPRSKPPGPDYELASSLTTDGYSNTYTGALPAAPCLGSGGDGGAAAPEYGRNFAKVVLTVDFRVAAGRQFDRTYSLQIGQVVAALGTCTEPTRFLGTDKRWTAAVDVTHLQAYLAPGQATRFQLANLLSSVYNVPIWASVRLEYFWDALPPSNAGGGGGGSNGGARPQAEEAAAGPAAAGAEVPDEVVPLVVPGAGPDTLVSVAGTGDSPEHWPRVTFTLPASLSELRNIYRAQLLVVPKANGCEEFWAMNPSGAATNSTCGGSSTGEPYREVRVYVNGQLAGFAPLWYTMYTGGIDPRLWQAIVAASAYSLPTYTFDLSPWLPQLNAQPGSAAEGDGDAASASGHIRSSVPATTQQDGGGHAGTPPGDAGAAQGLPQPAASRRLTGAALEPNTGRQSSDQRLPSIVAARASQHPAAACAGAGCSSHDAAAQHQQQHKPLPPNNQQQQQQQQGHSITVEVGGATGSDWVLASTLLLWRAWQDDGEPLVVTGEQEPSLLLSPGFDAPLRSDCSAAEGAALADAGSCSLQLRNRGMLASAALRLQGLGTWLATVQYTTKHYSSAITFNNSAADGGAALLYDQRTRHEARWEVARRGAAAFGAAPGSEAGGSPEPPRGAAPAAAGGSRGLLGPHRQAQVLTRSDVLHEYTNAGGVATGAVYELSVNATLQQPTVFATPAAAGVAGGSAPDGGARGPRGSQPAAAAAAAAAPAAAAAGAAVGQGRQRHYQRAIMMSVYNQQKPTCIVPDHPTHNVTLRTSVSMAQDGGRSWGAAAAELPCVARRASSAFCSANLTRNTVDFDATGC